MKIAPRTSPTISQPPSADSGQADSKANTRSQGETVSIMSDGRGPQLPHERDESSSSQDSGPRAVIQQAHRDLEAGLQDDDLGPPMDETYAREFRAEDDESGAKDAQPPERGGPNSGPRVHRA